MNIVELEKLTLETLITRGRDRFDLRYSTHVDLQGVTCRDSKPANGRVVKDTLTLPVFITFADNQQDVSEVILTGVRPTGLTGTSPVKHYDQEQGWVVTRSGSLYLLEGPLGDTPVDNARVLFIAGLFNYWGIGQPLGMAPIII